MKFWVFCDPEENSAQASQAMSNEMYVVVGSTESLFFAHLDHICVDDHLSRLKS